MLIQTSLGYHRAPLELNCKLRILLKAWLDKWQITIGTRIRRSHFLWSLSLLYSYILLCVFYNILSILHYNILLILVSKKFTSWVLTLLLDIDTVRYILIWIEIHFIILIVWLLRLRTYYKFKKKINLPVISFVTGTENLI